MCFYIQIDVGTNKYCVADLCVEVYIGLIVHLHIMYTKPRKTVVVLIHTKYLNRGY